ncbi:MAG: AIR synthase family protein [Candidatus Odinarchaeia archaeon]
MSKLNVGKITMDELVKYVLPYTGKKDKDVLIGPSVGEDAAVIQYGDHKLILKTDPISGALDKIGWEAIHINANDVAAKGAVPKWFLACLILPKTYTARDVEKIMKQLHKAALEVGVAIVGGHTEFTDGLTHPLVIGSMVGIIEDNVFLSTKNVRKGDQIILTKTAGIEATSILAEDLEDEIKEKFGENFLLKAQEFTRKISIVKEAVIAKRIPGVHVMHDCTEGGVITAVYEIAEASDNGLLIWEDKIPIASETLELTKVYGLNPLEIIASGSLLIAVSKSSSSMLIEKLKTKGIQASIIGEIKQKQYGRKIKLKNGEIREIKIPDKDPLWRLIDKIVNK